jgi:hypothetical protein
MKSFFMIKGEKKKREEITHFPYFCPFCYLSFNLLVVFCVSLQQMSTKKVLKKETKEP